MLIETATRPHRTCSMLIETPLQRYPMTIQCSRRSELAVAPPPKIRCPQISAVLEEVRPYDLPVDKILSRRPLPGGE